MAAKIIHFDPEVHQKVRHRDQLYVVFMNRSDFLKLSPDSAVVVHLVSYDKIIYHPEEAIQQLYTVRKRELVIADQHAQE